MRRGCRSSTFTPNPFRIGSCGSIVRPHERVTFTPTPFSIGDQRMPVVLVAFRRHLVLALDYVLALVLALDALGRICVGIESCELDGLGRRFHTWIQNGVLSQLGVEGYLNFFLLDLEAFLLSQPLLFLRLKLGWWKFSKLALLIEEAEASLVAKRVVMLGCVESSPEAKGGRGKTISCTFVQRIFSL